MPKLVKTDGLADRNIPDSLDRMDENIEAIEQMTKAAHLSDLVHSRVGNLVEFDTDRGSVIGLGLVKKQEFAVAVVHGSRGASFKYHMHEDSIEHLIVLTGRVAVTVHKDDDPENDELKTLPLGAGIILQPCVIHSVLWDEESDLLAVTIPADKGFPNGW